MVITLSQKLGYGMIPWFLFKLQLFIFSTLSFQQEIKIHNFEQKSGKMDDFL